MEAQAYRLPPLVPRISGTGCSFWPTPRSRDWKGGGKDCLDAAVGGQLNPAWVEWLMGFPLGWTGLNVSETP